MYPVSEYEILYGWSIPTLLKKIEHGFNFEILKKGGTVKEKKKRLLTKKEAEELDDLYYGEKNGG